MSKPINVDSLHQNTAPPPVRNPKLAALASLVGSSLEYYDYMLYATASALVFPHIFFPQADPAVAVLLSLATYGVSYVARPFGALIFGSLGDRLGRRTLLQLTIWLMGGATLAIGCLPTYAQIGVAAPALLVALRIVQGLSTAAEGSAGSTLALEHAHDGNRAFIASWTMSGVQGGQALASLAFIPVSMLPTESLYSWGWRVPFLLSVFVIAFAYVVRRRVPETPEFAEAKTEGGLAKVPVATLLKEDWGKVLRVVFCAFYAVPSSLASVFGLAYATSSGVGISRNTMLWAVLIANVVAVFAQPLWGMLADRIGRKPVWIGGTLLSAAGLWLYFAAISTRSDVLVILAAILFLGVIYSASNGVLASFFPEMFPTKVRIVGPAFGLQLGFLLFGFAPAIAQGMMGPQGDQWWVVVLMSAVLSVIAAIAAATAKETHRVPTADLGLR